MATSAFDPSVKDQMTNDENIIPAIRRKRLNPATTPSQVSSMSAPQSTTVSKTPRQTSSDGPQQATIYQAAVKRRSSKKQVPQDNTNDYVVKPQ